MKIPTARKLSSGTWFIQLRLRGQSIPVTGRTKKEAEAKAAAIKGGIVEEARIPAGELTLGEAVDRYISSREAVLSPSTIAGYKVIRRNRFPGVMGVKLAKLTPGLWQEAVNREAGAVSAKTLHNSAAFVQSCIAEATGRRYAARTPQVVSQDLPWLTPEQIPVFIDAIKGSRYEIPALLALSSLRQSEIVALRWNDIDLKKGCIRVAGATVKGDDGKAVRKEANKNRSSRRTVPFLIPPLAAAVAADEHDPQGFVYPVYNNVLRNNINRVCDSAGLPRVGIHGLRRSFASLCYHLGVPEAVTMMAGGWSDITTMRKIYTKISQKDIQKNADLVNDFFSFAK